MDGGLDGSCDGGFGRFFDSCRFDYLKAVAGERLRGSWGAPLWQLGSAFVAAGKRLRGSWAGEGGGPPRSVSFLTSEIEKMSKKTMYFLTCLLLCGIVFDLCGSKMSTNPCVLCCLTFSKQTAKM